MRDRPTLFVRVEDGDGQFGWGEVWCNFPSVGAEHRTRLINEMLAPMLVGRAVTASFRGVRALSAATSVLALQSGEAGPFAQTIAGVDIALWDLFAKRAKTPLWRMLGGTTGRMRVYASGINPAGSVEQAEAAMRRGHRAFKLKIGFDADKDRANLRDLRRLVGDGFLAVDVNQGWGIEQALQLAPALEEFNLAWLEEPLRADRPWSEWRSLQKRLTIPLAGGENIAGRENFAAALAEGVLTVVQPDAAKWGGITGCLAVARDVLASKRHYCPHFLGGGIGLLASAHLLAGSRRRRVAGGRQQRQSAARGFLRRGRPTSRTARSCCRRRRGSALSRMCRRSRSTGRFSPPARPACSHTARRSTGSRP